MNFFKKMSGRDRLHWGIFLLVAIGTSGYLIFFANEVGRQQDQMMEMMQRHTEILAEIEGRLPAQNASTTEQ